jgi:hypothetical protein
MSPLLVRRCPRCSNRENGRSCHGTFPSSRGKRFEAVRLFRLFFFRFEPRFALVGSNSFSLPGPFEHSDSLDEMEDAGEKEGSESKCSPEIGRVTRRSFAPSGTTLREVQDAAENTVTVSLQQREDHKNAAILQSHEDHKNAAILQSQDTIEGTAQGNMGEYKRYRSFRTTQYGQ